MLHIHIVESGGTHEQVTLELLRRRGHLERMGVSATRTLVTNGGEAADLVVTGKADVAMQVGFGPALAAMVSGAPLRVIAGANLLTVHAVYSKDPTIRRLKDLVGRRVGVGRLGALTHQLIYAALLKHGVDPAAVNFVPMGNSASIFKALLAGEVEAGFGETEVFDHQAHYGVHALEDAVLWNELPDFPNQASYATLEAIHTKREALVRTLAAYALLYRDLHDPAMAGAYAEAFVAGLPEAGAEEGRVQWRFYQQHHPFADDLMLSEAKLRYMQQLNLAMGLQDAILPYESLADMSLAREALLRIGDGGGR
jgi:ABC-type nitrate/sulfonate/bicarbonate transport system substrate-binding protein